MGFQYSPIPLLIFPIECEVATTFDWEWEPSALQRWGKAQALRVCIYIFFFLIYIYIYIYLFNILILLFFSCFSVGPPGVGPEHPIATFQRYKTSLELAQAQVDLRDLQIPGLTAKPLRTSLAPFKQPAAAKGAPEVIRTPKGARGSVQEVLFVHQLWRVALLQEVTFVHHYWFFLSTKEFSFYIQVKYFLSFLLDTHICMCFKTYILNTHICMCFKKCKACDTFRVDKCVFVV